jgi:hypothetical protein
MRGIHWKGVIMDLKTIPVTTFIVTIGGAEERGAAGELAAAPVGAVVEAHSVCPSAPLTGFSAVKSGFVSANT